MPTTFPLQAPLRLSTLETKPFWTSYWPKPSVCHLARMLVLEHLYRSKGSSGRVGEEFS